MLGEVGDGLINDWSNAFNGSIGKVCCVGRRKDAVVADDGYEIDVWIDEAVVVNRSKGMDGIEPGGDGDVETIVGWREDEVKSFFEVVVMEFSQALEVIDAGSGGEEAKGRVVFFHPLDEEGFDFAVIEGRWGESEGVGLHVN